MEFKPLAAKAVANGGGAATDLGNATVVYAMATAASTVTLAGGATFQMGANQALIFHKEKTEKVHASSANVHFTKIAYPRS